MLLDIDRIPIWFMRQAGRYLPEYKKLREKFPNFMEFCLNTDAVVKATLQPIERFDLDAAIIFNDILTIPHLFGQEVNFIENRGPVLKNIDWNNFISCENWKEKYLAQTNAIKIVRKMLAKEKSLIGFAGAPWTIMTYMIEGEKSTEFVKIKNFIINQPEIFEKIFQKVEGAVKSILKAQIEAGCDTVQLFDSWAAVSPKNEYIVDPTVRIAKFVTENFPNVNFIYYGRKTSHLYSNFYHLKNFIISLDEGVDANWVKNNIPTSIGVQGNFCNNDLVNGNWKNLKYILENLSFKRKNYIFNLGHGVLPQTPINNVYELIKQVREYNRNQ